MRPLHAVAAAILLVVLPITSGAFGDGFFAWKMYATTGEYRIEIRVKDASGSWRSVAPTGLAKSSTMATADVLIGADHFRRGPSIVALRAHLDELAAFACRARKGVAAEVVLRERRDERSPERVTTAHADCP